MRCVLAWRDLQSESGVFFLQHGGYPRKDRCRDRGIPSLYSHFWRRYEKRNPGIVIGLRMQAHIRLWKRWKIPVRTADDRFKPRIRYL